MNLLLHMFSCPDKMLSLFIIIQNEKLTFHTGWCRSPFSGLDSYLLDPAGPSSMDCSPCSDQLMVLESIAIVRSPGFQKTGLFKVTDHGPRSSLCLPFEAVTHLFWGFDHVTGDHYGQSLDSCRPRVPPENCNLQSVTFKLGLSRNCWKLLRKKKL